MYRSFAPFPLLDANHHPGRIDAANPEMQHFVEPQPGRVGGEQHRAVLPTDGVLEHPFDLLGAQDLRELDRLTGPGNLEGRSIALQRRVIEEAETVHDNVQRAPRSVPVAQEIPQVVLHLLIGDLVLVPRQSFDRPQVRLAGSIRQAPHDHILVHATT